MLHIITTSTGQDVLFKRIATGETILFLGDAVLCLHKGRAAAEGLIKRCQDLKCYALGPDLLLRGMVDEDIFPDILLVDYPEFVALTVEHEVIKTWN